MEKRTSLGGVTRRSVLRLLGAAGVTVGFASWSFISPLRAWAQSKPLGTPKPEEKVGETMKRLFGSRPILPADGKVKLDLPLLAENGAVVPVTVEANLPMTPANYVKNIYIISDKNRRPLNVQFTFTPEAGKAYVATNIRLAESTDVRTVVEMSDGTLYMAKREVKVTVGGCG